MNYLKRVGLILAIYIPIFSAQFAEYQNPNIYSAAKLGTAHRTITDDIQYNGFYYGNLKLGQIDLNRNIFSGTLGLRRVAEESDTVNLSSNNFLLPSLIMGTPDEIFFRTYYSLAPVYKDMPTYKTTSNIHRFTVDFGTQNEDKTFRFGFNIDGFGGIEKEVGTDDQRWLLGANDVGITFGSKPIDMLTLYFAAHASGFIDTLNSNRDRTGSEKVQDRFSELEIPRLTFAADVNSEDFPYRSSFNFGYSRKHYVYTSEDNSDWPNFHAIAQGNRNVLAGSVYDADPIVTDSIRFDWQNKGDIAVSDLISLHPALKIGYLHTYSKRMLPGGANHPMDYDDEHIGYTWETGSFNFGIGGSFNFNKFLDYWVEYGRANQKLDLTGDSLANKTAIDNDGYNRFSTGLSFSLHNLPSINYLSGTAKLFFDLSFMVLQENLIYGSYYENENIRPLSRPVTHTELYRYQPWNEYKKEVQTNEFKMGVRALFMNNALETAFNIGFLGRNFSTVDNSTVDASVDASSLMGDFSGINLNFDIVYNVKSLKK